MTKHLPDNVSHKAIVKAFINEYDVNLACCTRVLSALGCLVPTLNCLDYRRCIAKTL